MLEEYLASERVRCVSRRARFGRSVGRSVIRGCGRETHQPTITLPVTKALVPLIVFCLLCLVSIAPLSAQFTPHFSKNSGGSVVGLAHSCPFRHAAWVYLMQVCC